MRISILGLSKFLRESSFKCEVQVFQKHEAKLLQNQRDFESRSERQVKS
jgi:hypothetical protein